QIKTSSRRKRSRARLSYRLGLPGIGRLDKGGNGFRGYALRNQSTQRHVQEHLILQNGWIAIFIRRTQEAVVVTVGRGNDVLLEELQESLVTSHDGQVGLIGQRCRRVLEVHGQLGLQ